MQKTELIPFAGGSIEATTGPDGLPYINIRRVCEELGINAGTQTRKLKSKAWATTVEMTVVASDGKERTMSFLQSRAVPMWAATIAEGKVDPGLRPRLRAYQVEASEVLARHFMEPTNVPAVINGEDQLAKLSSIESMVVTSLKGLQQLGQVVGAHEHRLRALEAKPSVTVVMKTNKNQCARLLTRWIARFREETTIVTEGMSQPEKADYFREVHGRLKTVFGDKKNWSNPEKFYEGARWLLKNYGLDITDIEDPT